MTTTYEFNLYFAKVNQSLVWNNKKIKVKGNATKMSQYEWDKIAPEFKLVNEIKK